MKKIVEKVTIGMVGIGSFIGGMIFDRAIVKNRTKYCGVLHIDKSEADESEKIFLELTYSDVESLKQADTAIFKVIRKNYISQ